MNVTAVPATIHAPTSEETVRQRVLNYFFFTLCASLYLLPFMRLLLQGTDEGLLVSGAVRIVRGQVFARDFFEIVGPGTFYWLALFFKLFGVTFVAERICLFFVSLGTGLVMYFLSRRICERYRILPCVVLAGTYFGILWPTISHHVDSNFFALLSIACVLVWQDKQKNILLFAAGLLAGATTCFLQTKGVLLLCAFVLWLWLQYRKRSASLSSMGFLAGGYIGAVGLVLLYFWSQHALWDLIYVNVLWPSKHYAAANVVPYARGIFRDYWANWAKSTGSVNKWGAGIASVLVTPFVFIAVLPLLLLVLGVRHRKHPAKPEILLYWLCGSALWLAEIHRKDIQHLVFGSTLLIILCVHYLEEERTKLAHISLQGISISAACLAGFNLFLVLSASPMMTRVGAVAVFRVDPVLSALEARAASGEEIFVYPYAPMYYFLSETTNPTPWSGLGYNYNSASDFRDVVRVLDQRRIRHVLWDTGIEEAVLKSYFPSMKRARPDQRIIEPYLESHYKVVWAKDGVLIMERKSEGSAN